jgi:23S rRNA (pseudouridine1915-N3)-methyltransferase
MLAVRLICVGRMRERFYREAFEEYVKRLGAYCRLECVEIPEFRLPEKPSAAEINTALAKEAVDIVKYMQEDSYVVAMCVEGRQMPSEAMAELLAERESSGRPKLCFIVGGSYGLDPSVKDRADLRLSMSQMTFPHHLARVMLAEQLYRGYKIREGSKYHK